MQNVNYISGFYRLVTSKCDLQTIDGIVYRICMINILLNSLLKKALLTITQFLKVRFVL